jgi:hypothetical protein
MNSLNGTNIGASTTIGTYIWVNLIDITLGYCLHWALVNAATASGAIIGNYVSHCFGFLVKL